MMNPLHTPNQIFDLALMNPNPTSSKTKDGPIYRVSFEVERDVWDWFMEACTKGMILASKAAVVGEHEAEELETPKPQKGPYGDAWKALYKSGWWHCPQVWPLFGMDDDYLAWVKTQPCALKASGQCEGDVVAAHVRRINQGAGTGIKPQYSAIPLCNAHHQLQHSQGESAIGGKDAVDKIAAQCRIEWMKSVIYEEFQVTTLSAISPYDFSNYVFDRMPLGDSTAYNALPKEFK